MQASEALPESAAPSERTDPSSSLGLFFFAGAPDLARRALAGGVDTLVVDWEWRGKAERQREADTEINAETLHDLRAMVSLGPPRLCCRVNPSGPWTAGEVEQALGGGATDLLLPMVRQVGEVERFLRRVDGRARAGILVETLDACERAADLASLGLDLVYVGLNDLRLERGGGLFEPVLDGTLERLRGVFDGPPFGFGGLTVIDGGNPVPCRLLLAEMARLGCSFSFLRRSFRRDVKGRSLREEVAGLRRLWSELQRRPPEVIRSDARVLRRTLGQLYGAPASTGSFG